jgi:NAD(P) transhydrogenase subunit alpha
LGVGVAGLQAIATAKRLGAVVEASDVRPSVKDQVESLGGKYIEVPYDNEEEKNIAEGKGGYAQSMPQSWLERQKLIVSEAIKKADIVITTALIPGKSPPLLIDEATVYTMKPGSVIVDIAGGNCELTKANEIYKTKHTTIIGYTNLPSMLAHDASILYAKNVFNFIELIINENKEININLEDELIEACLIK